MAEGNITSPEGILMLMIAAFFDFVAFVIFIIEVWVDLGIFSVIMAWVGWLFVGLWAYLRGRMSLTDLADKLQSTKKQSSGSQKTMGSSNMEDWKQNSDGAYELKNGEATEPQNTSSGMVNTAKGFIKRVGWSYLVELVPWIGEVWPGLTIFVWRELKREDGSEMSQENKNDQEEAPGLKIYKEPEEENNQQKTPQTAPQNQNNKGNKKAA